VERRTGSQRDLPCLGRRHPAGGGPTQLTHPPRSSAVVLSRFIFVPRTVAVRGRVRLRRRASTGRRATGRRATGRRRIVQGRIVGGRVIDPDWPDGSPVAARTDDPPEEGVPGDDELHLAGRGGLDNRPESL